MIEVKNLTFTYQGSKEPVLKNVSFNVEKGKIVMLLGLSGSGKTTLISTFNGVIPKFFPGKLEGDVIINGVNVRGKEVNEMCDHIGLVFQDPALQLVSLTVFGDLSFGPSNLGLPRDEIIERVKSVIDLANLNGFEDRNPEDLSGGEQQSVAIAGILAMRPPIMVFDEPLTMLDPMGKIRVLQIVKELPEKYDSTILITESGTDIEETIPFVDELIVIDKGEIIAQGSPTKVFRNPKVSQIISIPQVSELALKIGEKEIPVTEEEAFEQLREKLSANSIRLERLDALSKNLDYNSNRGEPIIKLQNLHYTYPNGVKALNGIDIEIYEGELVGLIGQNGSGKSTTSLILSGLYKLPKDSVGIVDRLDLKKAELHDIVKKINYVFQNPDDQIFSDSALEEVAYGLKNLFTELSPEEIREKCLESLEIFGMEDMQKEFVFSLPINYKTYLTIASILAIDPKIMIVDEPTTGLDLESSRKVMNVLQELNKRGKTIIIISHNIKLIAEYTKRVIVLKEGKIFMDGTPKQVLSSTEQLKETMLMPPQITRLAQKLGDYGVPNDIITLNEMYELIKG
jgi:energy-coupling factor transport system ATP-binding protein